MNVFLIFTSFAVFFTAVVVVSKLPTKGVCMALLTGSAYVAIAGVVWLALWASGSGVVTSSITVALMLATLVPIIEWARRRR